MSPKSKKRHNKKRNTGLLYEFLIRHISSCALSKKNEEMNKALKIVKKHFQHGTPLHEELVLFNAINKTNVKSQRSVDKIMETVYKTVRKTNVRKLDESKSRLIKEVNHTLGQEVYNYKIPNYTVFASAQTLFNDARNKKKFLSELDKIKLEETISSHLLTEKKDPEPPQKAGNYAKVLYNVMAKKFYERYSGLNEDQKKLLMGYSVYLIKEDKEGFTSLLKAKSGEIKNKLSEIKDPTILSNKETMDRIEECKDRLDENLEPTDENVMTLLQYMELLSEVQSNG